jgi:hypothetical protein
MHDCPRERASSDVIDPDGRGGLQAATHVRSVRPPMFELLCGLLVRERPDALAALIGLASTLTFQVRAPGVYLSHTHTKARHVHARRG